MFAFRISRRHSLFFLVVLSMLQSSNLGAYASNQNLATVIVEFHKGVNPDSQANAYKNMGYKVNSTYKYAINGVSLTLPAQAISALSKNPNVQSVTPEAVATIQADQNPTPSWGLDRIDQRSAVVSTSSSYSYDSATAPVTVYVFDTGLNSSLEDFQGRIGTGRNFMSDQAADNTNDCNGHGTHVSGTALGTVYGVAKTARVVPVRVLDCSGSGTSTAILDGIDWAIQDHTTGLAIGSMSLGFNGTYSPVDTAIKNLFDDNVAVVVAAGNSKRDACQFSPARAPEAITVAATTSTDARASYSNFGSCVDIFAPGSGITSDWLSSSSGSTNTISGTSMATPHVSGSAAVILGHNPNFTPTQLTEYLISTATTGVVTSAGTNSPNRLLYLKNQYALTFMANDGSTESTTTLIDGGTQLSFPANPIRSGYTFNGWYTQSTGGALISAPYTPASSLTLYAQWTQTLAPTYLVTFDRNAGTNESTTVSVVAGTELSFPANPIRSGYAFNGWFTQSTGGALISAPYFPTSSLTLYAQWTSVPIASLPGIPTSLSFLKSGAKSAVAAWQPPAANGGTPITGYSVNVYKNGKLWTVSTLRSDQLSISLNNLSKGIYSVSVSAINAVGIGSPANSAQLSF